MTTTTTCRSPKMMAMLTVLGLCLWWGPQGSSANFCGVDSRPHPKGICGRKLVTALHNLCFLLNQDYPDMFSRPMRKRSLSVKNIDQIPVEVLAEMNLPRQPEYHQQTTGSASASAAESVRKLFLSLMPQDGAQQLQQHEQQQVQQSGLKMPGGSSSLLQAVKRTQGPQQGQEVLPVAKRSMVCDCCYNPCSASTLAQYCP